MCNRVETSSTKLAIAQILFISLDGQGLITDVNISPNSTLFDTEKQQLINKQIEQIDFFQAFPNLISAIDKIRTSTHKYSSLFESNCEWKIFKLHNSIILVGRKMQPYITDDVFNTLMQIIPANIWWKDVNGVYLGCNNNVTASLGFMPKEIIGKTDDELPWPEYAATLAEHDRLVIEKDMTMQNEEVIKDIHGKTKNFLVVKSPFKNNKGHLIGTVGISFDITEQKMMEKQLLERKAREAKEKLREALLENAAQVSHDIRSPLAALNTVIKDLSAIPENKRILIRNAVRRINNIANNLLTQYRAEEQCRAHREKTSELLPSLLDSLVSEKSAQTNEQSIELRLDINKQAYGVFLDIDVIQFRRVLSNLINNAIEATEGKGIITIKLIKNSTYVHIHIIDTGKGIPADQLEKVKAGGYSHGKSEGSGLGIAGAIQFIDAHGGEFDIVSEENKGTTIQLALPLAEIPPWFQATLSLNPNMTLVVLDDDESIHAIWDSRCQPYASSINLLHLYDRAGIYQYCEDANFNNIHFLIDYELIGSTQTGLDIIEALNLGAISTLVTSRYEELDIRERVLELGMRIIPKNYVPHVPIDIMALVEDQVDAVLIDDDHSIRDLWSMVADDHGVNLLSFASIKNFEQVIKTLDKSIPVYIDSNLGHEMKGEDYAEILHKKGFKNIYLTTGYGNKRFHKMPWIRDIIGKEPPFK